jgi:pimeloyl-ACP methyl ester carboxylesterase
MHAAEGWRLLMPTVRAGEIDLFYEQHGAGPDLVLVMGLGAHLGAWAQQTPAFAKQFRVTVFDNRGAGRSSAPDEVYSIAQMADDTVALLDALTIDRAHVVGASMGGMIAQELAISHPGRVDRVVLACTAYRRQQTAVMAHDTVDRLDRITAPTLVLVGAEDILTPVDESVELAKRIPGAHLRILPRGGHAFFAEYPAEVNNAVLDFLKRAD